MMLSRSLSITEFACKFGATGVNWWPMGYQFAHVEGYGRTAGKGKAGGHSVDSIVAEAERRDGACPHVTEPQKPILVYGVTLSEVADQAKAWAEAYRDSRGHKLRSDGLCLLAGVVSAPPDMDAKGWQKLKKDTLKWLKKEYGDALKSVVEHTDEPHPHLHFYAVPRAGERFDSLHDGLRAAREANADRGKRDRDKTKATLDRKAAGLAYAEAMRAWQDRFYETIGRRHGLTRIGPARRRLSRAGWKKEQQQAATIAKGLAENAALFEQLKQADARLKDAAERIKGDRGGKLALEISRIFEGIPQAENGKLWDAMEAKAEEIRRALKEQARGSTRTRGPNERGGR